MLKRVQNRNYQYKHQTQALNELNDINSADTPVPASPVIKTKTPHRTDYGRHKLGMLVHAFSSFSDAISTVRFT